MKENPQNLAEKMQKMREDNFLGWKFLLKYKLKQELGLDVEIDTKNEMDCGISGFEIPSKDWDVFEFILEALKDKKIEIGAIPSEGCKLPKEGKVEFRISPFKIRDEMRFSFSRLEKHNPIKNQKARDCIAHLFIVVKDKNGRLSLKGNKN